MEKGKLFIVSTPIGNLEDITFRALNTLKQVDLIASEDTRVSKKLLFHFDIKKTLTSYYSYNEKKSGDNIIGKLTNGLNVALISDAGTPGISDPSYYIINEALKNNIDVVPIPGASASIACLSVSGFKIDKFSFEGFLPRKKGKITKKFENYMDDDKTFIFYESPHRIIKTLTLLQEVLGDRNIVLGREITKKFEEFMRGAVSNVIIELEKKKKIGEVTVIVEGKL